MHRASLARFAWLLLLVAFQAWSFSARAAVADWRLFDTSKSAKVYFDRASLREGGDYVHYAVRVELAERRNHGTRRRPRTALIT